ncbi:hypothetical protein [Geoalkalibacter halelectricus]|uniref:Uncharacterized protein n=1 Tax=Geoalkalibacter halelectricus TaxID=2847045 RepID=A0ABY5ZNL6_9BACT|nr:hypothetical protein [Geoalkalibacter halelectricus]MDO3377497.1 hypothetical protein [Geoalkalibacter halelectricus]UWZ80742.1 hypothetical protein L9S41_04905 [Geoalkalibacter halelectricus]
MGIKINPSDLFYRYPKNHANKHSPKFCGKPDSRPFDAEDLFEVIPMLEAVMDVYGCRDGNVLNELEEVMVRWMPKGISRDQAFDILVESIRELFPKD